MTSKTAGLPMLMLDERRVVDAIAAQVAILLPKMRASHETLTSMLRERLRRGDLDITMKAVHAVEHEGDWLADSILRATYAEMRNRGEPMSIELQSFGLKAVLRPPLRRGRGRDRYAHWSRDAGICFLVLWVCAEFGVKPTRSRGARRDRVPRAAAWSNGRSNGTRSSSRKIASRNISGSAFRERSCAMPRPSGCGLRHTTSNPAICGGMTVSRICRY